MKRLPSIVALLSMGGIGLTLSTQPPRAAQDLASTQQPKPSYDTQNQDSARVFHGQIARVEDKVVLWESSTQKAYQLDDQDQAKQFEGKTVKVIATLDPATNSLHLLEIAPSGSQ